MIVARPQRLPDGRWRCEVGSGCRDQSKWCAEPAAWILEGCTVHSPGAIVCQYHREIPPGGARGRARWIRLDNPPAAPSTEPKP